MSSDGLPSAWSPARVALLRLHHALGLSAAVSAELIGEVSRNAVISKRRRLGLVGIVQVRRPDGERGCSASRTPDSWLSRLFWTPPGGRAGGRRLPLPCMDLPTPPDANPKPLTQRGKHECAWPLGSAETPGDHRTLFCCAPTQHRRSFCPVHSAQAYCPPEEAPGCRS